MDANTDVNIIGIPSTIISWIAYLNIIEINPIVNFIVSIFSITWLSLQIYGWVEKRIKESKNGSK